MARLPTGTVTFLFTDVEGSTRLLHEHREAYAGLLAEHRRLLREAFARHGGVEVDTQGDAFFYAFARASDALAAASEGTAALEVTPVRVRMGLHTGEPQLTGEGYVGMDVHVAARIAAAGHGGQVLLSERTAHLVRASDSLRLVDLGLHRLKDLGEPVKLFQLGVGEHPLLRTLNATNLPVGVSPLIGREDELATLVALLADGARLVTVTGAGGTGKTRFALQGAAELVEEFADGVIWVPLQSLVDDALVVPTIAQALGATGDLSMYLRSRRALLLLDNLEHLLGAAPALSQLLEECADLKLLVTSRAPLRVAGERELPLEPLPDGDAVTLFVDRARAAGGRVDPDATAAAICRRVDNLPLALELAAGRTRLLEPPALLARLDRSLPVLTGGRRDAPARQRTLRATIEWSYDLLDEDAQRLFVRLAVFHGSFPLEAAEAICDAGLDSLSALAELGLLKPVEGDRFLFLDTIREYAAERLEESGEAMEVRRRHAVFFAAVAEAAELSADADGPPRHDVGWREAANFRAAIESARAAGDAELALRIAVSLEQFWVLGGTDAQVAVFRELLPLANEVEPRLRARALRFFGACCEQAGLGEEAERLYEASLAAFEQLGDSRGSAHVLHRLGWTAFARGDLGRAEEIAEQALAIDRDTGNLWDEAIALGLLGQIAVRGGDDVAAVEWLTGSIEAARDTGFHWWHGGQLVTLALAELRLGRVDDAERHSRASLEIARRIGARGHTVAALGALARASRLRGSGERTGKLWGAVEAEEGRGPLSWAMDRRGWEADVIGDAGADFERGRGAGRELSLDEAVEYALGEG